MGDAVNFKGNKDGIVLLLDCSVEFETLCQMIVQKLWQSRGFLAEVEHYLAEGALAIRKNVRSGQKISYDGTLLIFGDVNAGAELVATGHIFVLGTLRGVAHAGCQGNKDAIVYATQLCSLQLRIADLIARAPDGESTERHVPEIARIMDNYLVIEEV